jgi:hypothetical protein
MVRTLVSRFDSHCDDVLLEHTLHTSAVLYMRMPCGQVLRTYNIGLACFEVHKLWCTLIPLQRENIEPVAVVVHHCPW